MGALPLIATIAGIMCLGLVGFILWLDARLDAHQRREESVRSDR